MKRILLLNTKRLHFNFLRSFFIKKHHCFAFVLSLILNIEMQISDQNIVWSLPVLQKKSHAYCLQYSPRSSEEQQIYIILYEWLFMFATNLKRDTRKRKNNSENPKLVCRIVCAPTVIWICLFRLFCRVYSFSHSIIHMRCGVGSNFNVTQISVEIDAVIIQLGPCAIRYWQCWIDAILHIIIFFVFVFFICWCWWMMDAEWSSSYILIVIMSSLIVLACGHAHVPAIKWFVDTQFMNDLLLFIHRFFLWTTEFHPHFVKPKTQVFTAHARTHAQYASYSYSTHQHQHQVQVQTAERKKRLCIIITNVYASNYICTSFYVNFHVCIIIH